MKLTTTSQRKSGFTLIELLAVIAIIGILFTLVSPQIGKARLKGKLTQQAAKGRYIVEAITAKEVASRFSLGWPQSDDPKVPASSTEFLADLVVDGFLDVDFSFFAGPGMTPARDEAEFRDGGERHNAWCVVLNVDDTTPGNFPAVYLKNLDINTFSFHEDAKPFGKKGFAFATKNGEAISIGQSELVDNEVFAALFNFKGKRDVVALLPSFMSDIVTKMVHQERIVTNLHTLHVTRTNTVADVVHQPPNSNGINGWKLGFGALLLMLIGLVVGLQFRK